jgi:4-hydroxyphenylacetate 3-monooxygenase
MNRVDHFPVVIEKLGELASLASSVRSGMLTAEYASTVDAAGFAVPDKLAVYGQIARQAELYPAVIHVLRDLSGGGVLQVPSSIGDMMSPETRPDIDRYITSPGVTAEERIKLFRLVWEAIGSELAGRHQQYEMFYNGAPHLTKMWAYQQFDYRAAMDSVSTFMDGYNLETERVRSIALPKEPQ